jgi:uncharacterized membrane protein YesL
MRANTHNCSNSDEREIGDSLKAAERIQKKKTKGTLCILAFLLMFYKKCCIYINFFFFVFSFYAHHAAKLRKVTPHAVRVSFICFVLPT